MLHSIIYLYTLLLGINRMDAHGGEASQKVVVVFAAFLSTDDLQFELIVTVSDQS